MGMGKYAHAAPDAARMFEEGYGSRAVAAALEIPVTTAEQWLMTFRAVGSEGMVRMGERREYGYETKVAAARDYVEGGVSKAVVMERYGIASVSPLNRWVRLYREGGPEALAPRPKGRPPGGREPTELERLEAENRRLRAEVAYLKKLRALEAEGRAPGSGAW